MAGDPYEIASKASTDFPPTLDQRELENKIFCIKGARLVTTKFGKKYVAVVQLKDEQEELEAWLGGVRVTRQLEALQEADVLPAWFKLIRDKSIEGEPYTLEKPDEVPAVTVTWAKKLVDLGREYGLTTERALELLDAKLKDGESPAGGYKRIMDELIKATGDREEANRLIYEKLYAKIVPPAEDELPFE